MDSLVISSQEQTVVVGDASGSVVVGSTDNSFVVVTGIMGPPGQDGIQNLSQAQDLDLTELADGSLLVYNSTSSRWKATDKLEGQTLEGGQF